MIKGKYVLKIPIQGMFLNEIIKITKSNLITLFGESFFLNRAINEELTPIQFIVLGNSSVNPRKTDWSLGNETARKKCNKSVDLDKKSIKLSASFTANEIIGTTEIGVSNGDILISHDVYGGEAVENLVTPTTGDITIDYYLEISTGGIKKREWVGSSIPDVYYVVEPNNVVGIFENKTNSGYIQVKSLEQLGNTSSAYYYDVESKNLYVHTTSGVNPGNGEIIILTR